MFNKNEHFFDYINLNWDEQRKHVFQIYSMTIKGLASLTPIKPDGLQTVVANVSLLALASGKTQRDHNGTKHITIERVAFFIHDGFDFDGDQPLGKWTCTENEKLFDYPFGTELINADFRQFRERTGYGCDFSIMSKPVLVWTGNFEYVPN